MFLRDFYWKGKHASELESWLHPLFDKSDIEYIEDEWLDEYDILYLKLMEWK